MSRKPKSLTKGRIADDIADMLELTHGVRHGPGHKLTHIIFDILTKALQRGEKVRINGFGIFRVKHYPPTKLSYCCFPYLLKDNKRIPRAEKIRPARKVIIFRPSIVLKRFINNEA